MNNFFTLLILGFTLSMDAFSLSMFLGTFMDRMSCIKFVILVGLFHFIMPILGNLIGDKISNIIFLNGDLIFGIILLFLAISVFMNLFKNEEIDKKFSFYDLVLLSFGVAIDSFSIGFALSFNETFFLFAPIIFSISSMIFTYIGLIVGKYSSELLGIYSKVLGGIVLIIFAIIHIF